MSGIPVQAGIIYGQSLSRRLGRSLGINLLGVNCKVCTFDCIYCQYGSAMVFDRANIGPGLPSVENVLQHVERAMKKPRTIDYLTFSGNGEPTLHPDFNEIVRGVLSLRNKIRPEAKLAILSNSSRVNEPDILSSLQLFDAPMMKLDAGDEKTFQAINRPAQSIRFSDIIAGLKCLPQLMIQSLMLDGRISNVRGEACETWVSLLGDLKPKEIHIYSTARPTAFEGVEVVEQKKLHEIAEDLRKRYHLNVSSF